MIDNNCEKRKGTRYDTELKVFIRKKYDIKTRVIFKIISSINKGIIKHKYSGFSRNISVEGLCFVSHHKLSVGDLLMLGVYPPNKNIPVLMEAEVCWQRMIPEQPEGKPLFLIGCKIIKVNGKPIAGSVHLDTKYNVIWSPVLDALFHDFVGIKMIGDFKK